jgi:hypothetical protein
MLSAIINTMLCGAVLGSARLGFYITEAKRYGWLFWLVFYTFWLTFLIYILQNPSLEF